MGKGGALSLVRSLALEHGRDGITANSVALGVMDSVREETVAAFRKVIPVGRLGTGPTMWRQPVCGWRPTKHRG
ncbi:MAG: hypothetical protein CM1200mP26_26550 [Acidimicrobiales bacterium]|nr:MAG: hypothetical protein CM1200mP26_26550 [Acidimicrobiales bacterium]